MKREVSGQEPAGRKTAPGGFTLIEIIVAIAILGISLVLVMQLFAGGLRAARTSCDYSRAVIHAKDKMEEIMQDPVQDSGEFDDGYKWEAEVFPYRENEDTAFNLMKVKVKVSWPDVMKNQRSVELVGLKAVSNEDEEL